MGFRIVCNDMIIRSELYEMKPWRVAGFVSSVVGLLCHALSPSFKRLIGGWDSFKVLLYLVVVFVILATIFFAGVRRPLERHGKLKAHVGFAVLILSSAYSFLYDKAKSEKPDVLSMVSNAAFALISLSLSKLLKLGFEVGMLAFFLGSLTVQLMTIHFMLIFVAIIYGYPLFLIHSISSGRFWPSMLGKFLKRMHGVRPTSTSRGRGRRVRRKENRDAQGEAETLVLYKERAHYG